MNLNKDKTISQIIFLKNIKYKQINLNTKI